MAAAVANGNTGGSGFQPCGVPESKKETIKLGLTWKKVHKNIVHDTLKKADIEHHLKVFDQIPSCHENETKLMQDISEKDCGVVDKTADSDNLNGKNTKHNFYEKVGAKSIISTGETLEEFIDLTCESVTMEDNISKAVPRKHKSRRRKKKAKSPLRIQWVESLNNIGNTKLKNKVPRVGDDIERPNRDDVFSEEKFRPEVEADMIGPKDVVANVIGPKDVVEIGLCAVDDVKTVSEVKDGRTGLDKVRKEVIGKGLVECDVNEKTENGGSILCQETSVRSDFRRLFDEDDSDGESVVWVESNKNMSQKKSRLSMESMGDGAQQPEVNESPSIPYKLECFTVQEEKPVMVDGPVKDKILVSSPNKVNKKHISDNVKGKLVRGKQDLMQASERKVLTARKLTRSYRVRKGSSSSDSCSCGSSYSSSCSETCSSSSSDSDSDADSIHTVVWVESERNVSKKWSRDKAGLKASQMNVWKNSHGSRHPVAGTREEKDMFTVSGHDENMEDCCDKNAEIIGGADKDALSIKRADIEPGSGVEPIQDVPDVRGTGSNGVSVESSFTDDVNRVGGGTDGECLGYGDATTVVHGDKCVRTCDCDQDHVLVGYSDSDEKNGSNGDKDSVTGVCDNMETNKVAHSDEEDEINRSASDEDGATRGSGDNDTVTMGSEHQDAVTRGRGDEDAVTSSDDHAGTQGSGGEQAETRLTANKDSVNGGSADDHAGTQRCSGDESAVTRGSDNQGAVIKGSADKDRVKRGSGDGDVVTRGSSDEDEVTRGSDDEDAVTRGSDDEDAVTWGRGDEDAVTRGRGDKDAVTRGSDNEDAVTRGSDDEDAVTRGRGDKDAVTRGSDDEYAVTRGSDDEYAVTRGRGDKDAVTRGSDNEDTVTRGSGDGDEVTSGSDDEAAVTREHDDEDAAAISDDCDGANRLHGVDEDITHTPSVDVRGDHNVILELRGSEPINESKDSVQDHGDGHVMQRARVNSKLSCQDIVSSSNNPGTISPDKESSTLAADKHSGTIDADTVVGTASNCDEQTDTSDVHKVMYVCDHILATVCSKGDNEDKANVENSEYVDAVSDHGQVKRLNYDNSPDVLVEHPGVCMDEGDCVNLSDNNCGLILVSSPKEVVLMGSNHEGVESLGGSCDNRQNKKDHISPDNKESDATRYKSHEQDNNGSVKCARKQNIIPEVDRDSNLDQEDSVHKTDLRCKLIPMDIELPRAVSDQDSNDPGESTKNDQGDVCNSTNVIDNKAKCNLVDPDNRGCEILHQCASRNNVSTADNHNWKCAGKHDINEKNIRNTHITNTKELHRGVDKIHGGDIDVISAGSSDLYSDTASVVPIIPLGAREDLGQVVTSISSKRHSTESGVDITLTMDELHTAMIEPYQSGHASVHLVSVEEIDNIAINKCNHPEPTEQQTDELEGFNNTEVLSDRISITWFKDLRKARQKGLIPTWGKLYDDRRVQGNVSPLRNGFRPGQYKHFQSSYGERERDHYRRDSGGRRHHSDSRSRSRTSPVMDESNSRSRSRSRSPRSDRSYSNSPSRSRSGSPRSWSGSPDRQRSPDNKNGQKPMSPDRGPDRSADRRDDGSGERDRLSKWEMTPEPHDKGRSPERQNLERSPEPKKWNKDVSPRGEGRKPRERSSDDTWDPSPRQRSGNWMEESPGQNRYLRSAVMTVSDRDKEDMMDEDMDGYGNDGYHRKDDQRYYEQQDGYQRRQRSRSPGSWRGPSNGESVKRSRTPPNMDPMSPRSQQYQDYDRQDNMRRREKYTPEAAQMERRGHSMDRDDNYMRDRRDSEPSEVKRRKYDDQDIIDNNIQGKSERLSKERHISRSHTKRNRNAPSPDPDEHQSRSSDMPSSQPQASAIEREVERGMLGLPPEKMGLVRQKKEEIEKAYRQDCETFASVVKMLISKETELENNVQNSLRENLKEIGQRCIQELREFIDKLKADDK